MEIKTTLIRSKSDIKQTLGNLIVTESDGDILFQCKTLELDWENNKQKISCISPGIYTVITRYSKKYGKHFHITNVPNRSLILFHPANYNFQLLGCVALGSAHTDIDGDGYRDVTNSRKTVEKFVSLMPETFKLTII